MQWNFSGVFFSGLFLWTKSLPREFSSMGEIEPERLKRSILEDLKSESCVLECVKKPEAISIYV